MSKREEGRFRGNLFGGFNRKDVLTYITSIYGELEQTHMENEALHERCDQLENLLQNLDKSSLRVPIPKFDPIARTEPAFPSTAEPIPEATEDLAPGEEPDITAAVDAITADPPESVGEPPKPTLKPSLANPYPGRATRVKVRPAKGQE